MTLIYILFGLILSNLSLTFFLTYVVQQMPQRPVSDLPDWVKITNIRGYHPAGSG
jgi:hypothetical protein